MILPKKKICFFSAYYYPHFGGVERYTHHLSLALTALNYEVTIVTFNTNSTAENGVIDGIRIIRIPVLNIFKNRFPIPQLKKISFKILREISLLQFDFFISNTRFYFSTLIAKKIANKNNKPLFIIDHGSGHMEMNNFILNLLGRMYEHTITFYLRKKNTYFFGVSEKVNNWLTHFNIKPVGVVYNSVDNDFTIKQKENIRKSYDISENATICTFAGRLIQEKGILILLDAFCELLKKHKQIFLFIAGDGPLFQKIKIKYNRKEIIFLGAIEYDNVMNLLSHTDIVVIPSYYPEGLPTLLLEAGINNCAVISTPQGGTKEVIVSNEYGIIVPPKSQIELQAAIEKLISDKSFRDELAYNLNNRIKHNFTWAKTAEVLDKHLNYLYNENEKTQFSRQEIAH